MSEADRPISCPHCRRKFSERQLKLEYQSVERCPQCNEVVRYGDGFQYSNVAATIAGDVMAIDAWIDEFATSSGITFHKSQPTGREDYLWCIGIESPYACEAEYNANANGVVAIRLVTNKGATTLFSNRDKFARSCAEYGLQPYAIRRTDSLSGREELAWGVTQCLLRAAR